MTRERFESLFTTATSKAIAFAQTMVTEDLSPEARYVMRNEQGEPVGADIAKDDLVNKIWSSGQFPEWIDLIPLRQFGNSTLISVAVAGKLVSQESASVYASRELGPFGIKSPVLPVGWKSVEESGRFSLQSPRANQSPEADGAAPRGSSQTR